MSLRRAKKDELRKRVDEELAEVGRSVPDELYEYVVRLKYIADEIPCLDHDDLVPMIADMIEWVQEAPIPMDYDPHWFKPEGGYPMPRPPAWWQVRNEQRFAAFEALRQEVLGHLGVEEVPDGFEDEAADAVWTILRRLGAEQREEGDELHLPMKFGIDTSTGGTNLQDWVMRRGSHLTKRMLRRRVRKLRASARENAAAFLHDAMLHVARRIGCSEADALSYLLWGEVPQIDWISVTPMSTRGALQILVRHPEVPPQDVAAAYRAVRDSIWGPRRRGRKEGQLRLAEIADRQLRENGRIDWDQVQRELKTRHGIHYKNTRSAAQTWRNYNSSRGREFAIKDPRQSATSRSEGASEEDGQ